MSDKLVEQWSLRCRHCGKTFVHTQDQLMAGHMQATIRLMGSGADPAEVVDNFMIPCPHCDYLVPFEPMSQFRRRKVAKLRDLQDELERLKRLGGPGGETLLLARALASTIVEMTDTVVPIDELRRFGTQFIERELTKLSHPAAAGLPFEENPNALRIVREMMRIAVADIGDSVQLAEVAKGDDDVTSAEPGAPGALGDPQQGHLAPAAAPTSDSTAAASQGSRGYTVVGCACLVFIQALIVLGIWWLTVHK